MTIGKTTMVERPKPEVVEGFPCEEEVVEVAVAFGNDAVACPTEPEPALGCPAVVTTVVMVWVAVVVVVAGGRVTMEVEVWVVVDVVVTGERVVVSV
jgi:hypothetical protein